MKHFPPESFLKKYYLVKRMNLLRSVIFDFQRFNRRNGLIVGLKMALRVIGELLRYRYILQYLVRKFYMGNYYKYAKAALRAAGRCHGIWYQSVLDTCSGSPHNICSNHNHMLCEPTPWNKFPKKSRYFPNSGFFPDFLVPNFPR